MSSFAQHLFAELHKLFARKRTHIGFAAFLTIELGILALLQLERVQKSIRRFIEGTGFLAEDYLSGLTLAFIVVLWSILLLGALYLALVAGDMVSKEAEDGTLRMTLCRPISRARLLLIKILTTACYTAVLVVFICLTALAAGLLYRGTGGLFVYAPMEGVYALYGFREGLLRFLGAIPLLVVSMFTISSLGLFLSCLNMKPAAATIITLSYLFIDTILKNIPYFESLRDWFITARMTAWVEIFRYQIPWERMLEDYAWLAGINATLLFLAWVVLENRDFKS